MKHVAILFMALSTFMGLAAIVRSIAFYQLFKREYLRYFSVFVILVWVGHVTRLVTSYLLFNQIVTNDFFISTTNIFEAFVTLAGIVYLVAAIRLLARRPTRAVWVLFLTTISILLATSTYNNVSFAFDVQKISASVMGAFQVVLLAVLLWIAVSIVIVSRAWPRLQALVVRGVALALFFRPLIDFGVYLLEANGLISYFQFIMVQYFVEFLTYLGLLVFVKKFATTFQTTSLAVGSQEILNQHILDLYSISKRERQVIELVLAGLSNKEISEELTISPVTVKDHIYRIYKKTAVSNRVQLTNLFRK